LDTKDVRKLDQTRKRLIKNAKSEVRVTYQDVIAEAGYGDTCCQRTVEDSLRNAGVRYRAPGQKAYISADDAKKRLSTAKVWIKKPKAFWSNSVHAFVDNKVFPMPLTPKQRSKFRQTQVRGHLRTPTEGIQRGFTKPKTSHTLLGVPSVGHAAVPSRRGPGHPTKIPCSSAHTMSDDLPPSVNISAAVAKDRVIMWHANAKTWNGAAAATMYAGPLKRSLARTWGKRRGYTIVEDGDRKGNQSGKGLRAKVRHNIKAMTLPPRTPAWMPLDYAVWTQILRIMDKTTPKGKETKANFLKRLDDARKALPRGFVKKTIAKMKSKIQGVIDAKGYHSKND